MGNTIQDLIVTLGGDTTGIEGALGTVNKILKEFGMSFKGMIEGLSFSALIAATVEAGETFEKTSIQIQRATGASGAALDGMEESFKNLYATSSASSEAIAGALTQISQKTGATGSDLEALTRSELQFAKVTGGDVKTSVDETQKLFAQWHMNTAEQSVALDVLYVAMQKSGLSAQQLSSSLITMGPALRNLKFGFEEQVAIVASFGKAGLDATDMTMGLTKAFKVFSEAQKDPKQALLDLIERMGDAKTRADAFNEAVGIFGPKAAGRLVDAVASGAFSLDQIKAALDGSSGAVKDMSDKTETLSGALGKFGHQLNILLAPLGVGFVKAMTDAMSGLDLFIESLRKKTLTISDLMRGMLAGIPGGAGAAAASVGADMTDPHHTHLMGPMPAPVVGPAPSQIGAGGAGTGGGAATGLETLDVTEKLRGITGLNDAMALLVAQENLEIAAHKAVTEATAQFNEALGTSVSQTEYLAIKLAAATLNETAFFDEGISKAPEVISQYDAMAKTIDSGTKTIKLFETGITAAQQAALDTTPYGQLSAAFGTLKLNVSSVTDELDNKLAAAFTVVATSNLATTSEIQESWGAASAAITKLAKTDLPSAIAAYNTYIDALKRTGAAIGDIYAAQEKQLQLEIQMKQSRGQSSAAEIVQLTNVQMRTQALETTSAGLGTIYKGLAQTFDQAFGLITNTLVAGITRAKTWGQVWHDSLKSIESTILTVVIGAFTKMAEAWIVTLVTKKVADSAANVAQLAGIAKITAAQTASAAAQVASIATITAATTASIATIAAAQSAAAVAAKVESSLLDVAEVTGQAAIGGAGVAAWTAAIPIIGPGLAIEAGLAETAAIEAAFGPLATFSHGGMVPEDMLALVHKGEYFLPAHETARAAAGGGGGGVNIHFYGNFNGVTQDLVNTVMNKAITAARRAGAKL